MPVLKPQGQGLFKFCTTVQCHISSVFFLSQTFILWTKRAHRSKTFRLLSGWVKIHQILYVMFETTSQFFFELFITLQCHEKLFCTFWLKLYMSWIKRAYQSAKFQTFHYSCKISPNLYFHRLLLLGVYKILGKKEQRSHVS